MRGPNTRTRALLVTGALLALLVVGSLGLLAESPAGRPASAPGAPLAVHTAAHPVPAATLHGDLVVTAANSPYVISPATSESSVYIQEGNITVQSGGTLVVSNEAVAFLQFISNTGPLPGRVSHIFTFDVQGKAIFDNSTLTTDASLLNAYQKLTVNVSGGGALTLQNSTFEFPGWLSVYGAGSRLTANQSTIRGTASAPLLVENLSIAGDSEWAPILSVGGGASAVFDNSSILNTFKDNSTRAGSPGPVPLTAVGSISSAGGFTVLGFPYPTDAENVTRALSYPSFLGGTLDLYYNTNTTQTSVGSSLNILGTSYPVGPIQFVSTETHVAVAVPPAALTAINAVGPMGWLESTGAFDDPPSTGWTLGATNAAPLVNFSLMALSLTPAVQYNITVSGAGTTLTAVDTVLDLNWNLTPAGPYPVGTGAPAPWGSNKLILTDGASAFLANISVTHAKTAVFWNDSAILPDASSTAYLYRWAEIPVEAAGGVPVIDAQLTAFYSYDSSQSNNATATSLNDLSSTSPALAAYVVWWDAQHGISTYGATDAAGDGFLLLADTVLQQATLPDGSFLGGYHVAVRLAGLTGAEGVQWGYAGLTAFPNGLTPATPDMGLPVTYSNYVPSAAIGSINVLVDGAPAPNVTINIGAPLTIEATIDSTGHGAGAVDHHPAVLREQHDGARGRRPDLGPLAGLERPAELHMGGQPVHHRAPWDVHRNVHLGRHLERRRRPDRRLGERGVPRRPRPLIDLPYVHIAQRDPPDRHGISGRRQRPVQWERGRVDQRHRRLPGGVHYQLGTAADAAGPVQVAIVPTASMTPGVYEVIATAEFNGATATVTQLNAFTIPSTSSPATNPLDQKYGPFTLLEWIIIAIAAVAAVLIGLFLLRRSARGKLVECGECGTPIPESATVCPKCGAEFETEIVRCSRCGSTIPADLRGLPRVRRPAPR